LLMEIRDYFADAKGGMRKDSAGAGR